MHMARADEPAATLLLSFKAWELYGWRKAGEQKWH